MKAMIVSILALLASSFERRCEKIGAAIEARDLLDVIFQIALLLAYIAGLTAATLGLVALISKFGKHLLIPGGIIVLICAFGKKKRKETPHCHRPRMNLLRRCEPERKRLTLR